MNQRAIGIFDSGVGGLTVLKEVEKLLPNENIIYFGDTARVPYGNKSKSTIIKFSTESALFLLKKNVKAVVVACNTSTSFALDHLEGIFNIPIVGVINAGVEKALSVSRKKKIGVIGTKATIASNSYQRKIHSKDKKMMVYQQDCPLFVPLVEEGLLRGKIAEQVIDMYLKKFKTAGVDTVILGCTHYPLLKNEIAKYLKGAFIVDSAKEVARYVKGVLCEEGLLNDKKRKGKTNFFVTDEPQSFVRSARLFLNRKISNPEVVNV
ncbi:MAG: glutamate racemase [Candidatus Omnitrophica bacterium]|nr:glutamate racemase [Candidatus Omnitrophota bacterium]